MRLDRTAKQCGESDSYRLRGYRPRYVNASGESVAIAANTYPVSYLDYLNAWDANESSGDFIEYT